MESKDDSDHNQSIVEYHIFVLPEVIEKLKSLSRRRRDVHLPIQRHRHMLHNVVVTKLGELIRRSMNESNRSHPGKSI